MAEHALLRKWQELPLSRRIMAGVVLVLGFAAGLWFLVFKPHVERIRSLQSDISSLDKTISQYKRQLQALPKLRKELQVQRTKLIYAKTLLPETNSDAENVLSSIEKLGNDVGIEFLLFSPGKEKKQDFYASRTVTVRFQGTFHNLMRFFSHLSGLDRLVTLDSVRLRPVSTKNVEGVSLQADCRISIYRILSDKEITTQDASS